MFERDYVVMGCGYVVIRVAMWAFAFFLPKLRIEVKFFRMVTYT